MAKPLSELSKRVQMPFSVSLIQQEIKEFCPRRVLVLAGSGLFSPFAEKLGLEVKWSTGFVQGVAVTSKCKWVIAQHPQGKQGSNMNFVKEISQAFAS